MTALMVFVLKIFDNGLSTARAIFINKEKYFLGAMLNAASTFFYLVALVELTKNSGMKSILSMCLATFIGTYVPGIMIKKSEREKLYIFDITADTLENGIKFADMIRESNIAVKTYSSYDTNMVKTLSCKAYCTTKEESKFINSRIPKSFKYHVYVPVDSE